MGTVWIWKRKKRISKFNFDNNNLMASEMRWNEMIAFVRRPIINRPRKSENWNETTE